MVWYSHLFKNFPQFAVNHTIKGFGIVNKAEVSVFWWIHCSISLWFSFVLHCLNMLSTFSLLLLTICIISFVKCFVQNLIVSLFITLFWAMPSVMWDLSSLNPPGMEPTPLCHYKHGILTTGLPGRSILFVFVLSCLAFCFLVFYVFWTQVLVKNVNFRFELHVCYLFSL